MLEFLALVVVAVFSSVLWGMKKSQARTRLREIDQGLRCIACDRTNLQRGVDIARCLSCGHAVSLSSLQAAVVSAQEIENVTRPDDRQGLP